jgi:hypothetical protein
MFKILSASDKGIINDVRMPGDKFKVFDVLLVKAGKCSSVSGRLIPLSGLDHGLVQSKKI